MLLSKVAPSGMLHIVLNPGHEKADRSWRLRNMSRRSYIWGWAVNNAARTFSKITGVPTLIAELSAKVYKADGRVVDYGVLSRRVVTDAGVAFLVDDWDDDTTDITTMNFHACGTGVVAENVTDTGMGTESTTIINPDTTRATGTKSQPSANILQSVGTVTFDGAGAITEHGLMDQASTAGGSLWDRSVFTAINVASADSIQFTYQCTLTAGS